MDSQNPSKTFKDGFKRIAKLTTAAVGLSGSLGAGLAAAGSLSLGINHTRNGFSFYISRSSRTAGLIEWRFEGLNNGFITTSSSVASLVTTNGFNISVSEGGFGHYVSSFYDDRYLVGDVNRYQNWMAVNNTFFDNPDATVDLTDNTLTTDTVSNISAGIDAQIQYYYFHQDGNYPDDRAIVRSLYKLTNTTGSAIPANVLLGGNVAYGGAAEYTLTANGDQTLDTNDAWIVTGNHPFGANYGSARTSTRHGSGNSIIPSNANSQFMNQGADYERDYMWRYEVTVPANETIYLLTYTEYSESNERAASVAHTYNDEVSLLNYNLTQGLSQDILDRIVNYDFASATITDADSDGTPDPIDAFPNNSSAAKDTDGDGRPDSCSGACADGLVEDDDDDNDGLLDSVETNTGVWVSENDTGTNPLLKDSDFDTLSDGVESNTGVWLSLLDTGSNPNLQDSDSDTIPDSQDFDSTNNNAVSKSILLVGDHYLTNNSGVVNEDSLAYYIERVTDRKSAEVFVSTRSFEASSIYTHDQDTETHSSIENGQYDAVILQDNYKYPWLNYYGQPEVWDINPSYGGTWEENKAAFQSLKTSADEAGSETILMMTPQLEDDDTLIDLDKTGWHNEQLHFVNQYYRERGEMLDSPVAMVGRAWERAFDLSSPETLEFGAEPTHDFYDEIGFPVHYQALPSTLGHLFNTYILYPHITGVSPKNLVWPVTGLGISNAGTAYFFQDIAHNLYVAQKEQEHRLSLPLVGRWELSLTQNPYEEYEKDPRHSVVTVGDKTDAFGNANAATGFYQGNTIGEPDSQTDLEAAYLVVPYHPNLSAPTSELTLFAYASKDDWSQTGKRFMASRYNGDQYTFDGSYAYALYLDNGDLVAHLNGNEVIRVDASYLTSGWHQFAMIYDGEHVELWVDQSMVGRAALTGDLDYGEGFSRYSPMVIGYEGRVAGVQPQPNYDDLSFEGDIAEVRLYQQALNGDQLSDIHQDISLEFPLSNPGLTDTDSDGISDDEDNCPNVANTNQADQDFDMLGNVCDPTYDGDGDGVVDFDDLFPTDPSEHADNDSDGIGDNADLDDDNDQIPDTFEIANGLDSKDPSDAIFDQDEDGASNYEEYLANTNPQVDDYGPVLTVPADVTVNASNAGPTEVNLGLAQAVDFKYGDIVPVPDNTGPFVPGIHFITWSARDPEGNTTLGEQRVYVIPRVNLEVDRFVDEGSDATLLFSLNGTAVNYPVTIHYSFSGDATNPEDHNGSDGVVVIEDGREASIDISIVKDRIYEGEETLTLSLGEITNAAAGSQSTQTLTITQENVAPQPTIEVRQGGNLTNIVTNEGGDVSVSVSIEDPNPEDSHTIDWSTSDSAVFNIEDVAATQYTFDPSGLAEGFYNLSVAVQDDGQPLANGDLSQLIQVINSAPTLADDTDSDGDGISDADEGFSDSDNDRVPDYLDSTDSPSVVLLNEEEGTVFETQVGLTLRLGKDAFEQGYDATLDEDQVEEEAEFAYPNDILDFEILGVDHGDTAQVVFPLKRAIPAAAIYRKYNGAVWSDFTIDDLNFISSTDLVDGNCPGPGDAAYVFGLNQGDQCIQLTLEDGGPNDADGEANGTIDDPGGIAVPVNISLEALPVEDISLTSRTDDNVMMRLRLSSDSGDVELNSLSFSTEGTGNETGVTAVRLLVDNNQDGLVDIDDTQVASGTFTQDDSDITINLDSPYEIEAGETDILVLYDFRG